MIQSIHIAETASFAGAPEVLRDLSTFNYIFGSNGTGKTTVSRIIADEGAFPTCRVTWTGGTKLQPLVYNRDFVERNFDQSKELKGVFTLGEGNVETLNRIEAAKNELDGLANEIKSLTLSLQGDDGAGGKKGELAALEAELKQKCWAQKKKHETKLSRAFEGFRNDQEKFKRKVIQEWTSNVAAIKSLAELEERASTIFGASPSLENFLPTVDAVKIVEHESNSILAKRVIGKDDVNIAAMIKHLGNSDWVREGRAFYNTNDRVCPFCQQTTEEAFAKSLDDYFDATFETDSRAIDVLMDEYKTDAERLHRQMVSLADVPTEFLDVDALRAESVLLDSKIALNEQRLALKKRKPSQVVALERIHDVSSVIEKMIESANTRIADRNMMVANLSDERRELTTQVWKFLIEKELNLDLSNYQLRRSGLDKAVVEISAKIASMSTSKAEKADEIRRLEKQTASINPAIDGINDILSRFGFANFFLAKSDSGEFYKLIRSDGSDAKATLSEGEKNFVTFLYFYHLMRGNESESGMTTDRVVVFDDPVSSLDCDILFVVSSLIKGLCDEVRSGDGYIKQVFVLTHNVYFHKEVTFVGRRARNAVMKGETFWVVRRMGVRSRLKKDSAKPISTAYELLWAELKRSERSNLTVQNTLRRILESYFKVYGGIEFDTIAAMFEGEEKLICNALISWIHDGSHYAHDDLYVVIDDAMVDTYEKVFEAIFEKSGHGAHYEMMMSNARSDEPITLLIA